MSSLISLLFLEQPIFVHSDLSLQFIIEVDAWDCGVGDVLSQPSPIDQKLHFWALFSHCQSPAEKNYDVGKRGIGGCRPNAAGVETCVGGS